MTSFARSPLDWDVRKVIDASARGYRLVARFGDGEVARKRHAANPLEIPPDYLNSESRGSASRDGRSYGVGRPLVSQKG